VWKKNHESIWITPWGRNGARIRVTRQPAFRELPHALLTPPPASPEVRIEIGDTESILVNGELTMKLTAAEAGTSSSASSPGKPSASTA
jgi:hypothetical protein